LQFSSKSSIRNYFKDKRKSLSKKFISKKSLILKEKINDFTSNSHSNIAFYYPLNGELDIIPAMKHIKDKHSLFLPKVSIDSKILKFLPFSFGDELENNIKINNLLEPVDHKKSLIAPDIVFVPLVAVDSENNRIGMGGGYYDATIEYYRKNKLNTKFIGIAYDFQLIDIKIKTDKHDQKLDKFIII
jgi:5-formyltetrahydrofolate cyclo-ligase